MLIKIVIAILFLGITGCKLLDVDGIQYELENCKGQLNELEGFKLEYNNESISQVERKGKFLNFLYMESEKNEYFVKLFSSGNKSYFQLISALELPNECKSDKSCSKLKEFNSKLAEISGLVLAKLSCKVDLKHYKIIDFKNNKQGFKKYSDIFENDIIYY